MSNLGVVAGDFNQIHNDMKVTVSYQVVTKTIDPITGDEILTYANASNVDLIFFNNENKYIFDKDGLLKVGDAYIIAKTTVGIKRYDKFTINNETYIVDNTITKSVAGVTMQDYANCFKSA